MKLKIEKPIYGGDCLARLDDLQTPGAGKKVFVPLTLPGETVDVRLTEDKRAFARAEVETVQTASPDRVDPKCPHFGACGGCHYQHVNYSAQLAIKRSILRETLERARVPILTEISTLSADPWQYRNRIRLAFSPEGKAGYRGRRSHQIVPINTCPISIPVLAELALNLSSFLTESPSIEDIAEIEVFTNHDTSELLLTRFNDEDEPHHTGLRFIHTDSESRPKLSRSDSTHLTYHVAGFDYRVRHGAFFQINRNLLDSFTRTVTDGLSGTLAWDLYAGVGLFARRLTESFSQVHAVESASASTSALEHNLAGTGGRAIAATTLDYLRRNREQREPRPDLIVVDPPRAGLGDEVTHLLNAIGSPQLVYVSCDPATLARDLHALTRERYQIERMHMADMFPQTFHIETIVHLLRA